MSDALPGFLVLTGPADGTTAGSGAREGWRLTTWDLSGAPPEGGSPLPVSRTVWSSRGPVSPALLQGWMTRGDEPGLRSMMPPFAALAVDGDDLVLATDVLGFRQVFVREDDDRVAVSTSARALATLPGGGTASRLDRGALLLQSRLGYQLGQDTVYAGVRKLEPGTLLRWSSDLRRSRVTLEEGETLPLSEAVRRAAAGLREFLERYLDANPEPTLQLTGGQDSRLVLSAIPPARRHQVRALTMGDPGTPDVDLAAEIAGRLGLQHAVRGLADLGSLSPAECFERVRDASARLDAMADPLAKAATLWAEEGFEQGARLGGLGGEIGRGFFYTGRVRPRPVTDARTRRLARWRLFVNEAVEPAALDPSFAADASRHAMDVATRTFADAGPEWYGATDEVYLWHRMQRWAGLSETAVCFDRELVNPLLDAGFLRIARALAPRDKAHGRFLARLQVALDADLAALPLEGRPSPAALAGTGPAVRAAAVASTGRRVAGKVAQRLARHGRAPAGGHALANGVLRHVRATPAVLDPVRGLGIFSDAWLDDLTAGRTGAQPATVSFLVNVLVAQDATTH